MTPTSPTGGTYRAQVRHDKFAIFDIGREHHLKCNERWLLVTLCQVADFRSRTFTGTIFELAEWTGIGRGTIPGLIESLRDKGLVEIVHPFGGNRCGEIEILVWDRLIVPERNRAVTVEGANAMDCNTDRIAQDSRTIRGPIAQNPAIDQGKEGSVRNKATREEVGGAEEFEPEGSTDCVEPMCAHPGCTEAIPSHTFSDHEPVVPDKPPSDWRDVSNLTDEELGLFPCDREELNRVLAEDCTYDTVGMTDLEAVTTLTRAFPGAELVSV